VDNGGVVSSMKTELIAVPVGAVSELGDKTLTDFDGNFPVNYYVDSVVNVFPDLSGNTIVGEPLFTVASNNVSTLTFTEGGLEQIAQPGEAYRGLVGVFDEVEIRGKAQVTTLGDILIHQGDVHSGDVATFEIEEGSSLTVQWLDLPNGSLASIIGDITAAILTCLNCP
jgi:hypothetical protein